MTDMPATDDYGRAVVLTTNGGVDTYTVTDGDTTFVVERFAGTAWEAVFSTINAMAPADLPPPPTPVPSQVTRWQAMQAMLATPSKVHAPPATVFSDIQAVAVATGGVMLVAWQNQQFVYRNGPFVAQLKAPLGLTDAILDAMFIAAAQLPE